MTELDSHQSFRAVARAGANVAIAKYWGKRDEALNLPLWDSVSFSLEALVTETEAVWHEDDSRDALVINDWQVPAHTMGRIRRILDRVRELKQWDKHCTLISHNNFPLSAGLASSASGCAAAALAAVRAAELELDESQISAIARLGSGSAARSITGGWSRWKAGSNNDGSDSYAVQIAPASHWPLDVFVLQISPERKAVSSTECMKMSMKSPFWNAYVAEASRAADVVQNAVMQRDFAAFSAAMHKNMMLLHALAMTCTPPVCYFAPKTVEIMQKILRASTAVPVCCTLDAGANIVIVCESSASPFIKNDVIALGMPYIQTKIGGPAETVEC